MSSQDDYPFFVLDSQTDELITLPTTLQAKETEDSYPQLTTTLFNKPSSQSDESQVTEIIDGSDVGRR